MREKNIPKASKKASQGAFCWAFALDFAFVKAKSQPKRLNAPSTFAQKQLSS
jgi:hypothetical protein